MVYDGRCMMYRVVVVGDEQVITSTLSEKRWEEPLSRKPLRPCPIKIRHEAEPDDMR